MHLALINELEQTFDIVFSFDELTEDLSIGDIVNVIMNNNASNK